MNILEISMSCSETYINYNLSLKWNVYYYFNYKINNFCSLKDQGIIVLKVKTQAWLWWLEWRCWSQCNDWKGETRPWLRHTFTVRKDVVHCSSPNRRLLWIIHSDGRKYSKEYGDILNSYVVNLIRSFLTSKKKSQWIFWN